MAVWAKNPKPLVLSHLPELLRQFADNCEGNGMQVHWGRDAEEHNQIVAMIIKERGKTKLAKSKSLLTEEVHLVPYLEARGIECIETGLGERILQLRQEPPSHIVVPAIHLKKEEIGELFHEKIGTGRCALCRPGTYAISGKENTMSVVFPFAFRVAITVT